MPSTVGVKRVVRLRGRGQPPWSRARRSAARKSASSAQPSAAASSASSDAAANASAAAENLADTAMPRDRRISRTICARASARPSIRPCTRPSARPSIRPSAWPRSNPLAPLRAEQRIVVRAGTVARTQCRCHPLHRRARLRRRRRLVQRHVNLFGPPTRERPALGRNPEPAMLQHMNRQSRAPPACPARRRRVRHVHPHFRKSPRLVQRQFAPPRVRWCDPPPAPRRESHPRRLPWPRAPAAWPAPDAGTPTRRPA